MAFGTIRDQSVWKQVSQAYYEDKLDAAYDGAVALGTGYTGGGALFFRTIEAEYLTRKSATQHKLADWLTIEIPTSESLDPQSMKEPILQACDESARRLQWKHSAPILITILTQEADAPWVRGRFGYFVDKFPYDKICIPFNATLDNDRLMSVAKHEYAHAIVLIRADGYAPRWLDEMIATTIEGGPEREYIARFASGAIPWLNAHELEAAFFGVREGAGGEQVFRAYQQAACIGAYLVDEFGEEHLSDLLTSFADNPIIKEIAMRAAASNRADEAIKETYLMSEKKLFEKSLEWVKTNR